MHFLLSRQRMREQGDDREQPQQGGRRAGNGQISPLPLSFDTKVRAHFLKRDFHLPPLDEGGHNLSGDKFRSVDSKACGRNLFWGSRITTQRMGTGGIPV